MFVKCSEDSWLYNTNFQFGLARSIPFEKGEIQVPNLV